MAGTPIIQPGEVGGIGGEGDASHQEQRESDAMLVDSPVHETGLAGHNAGDESRPKTDIGATNGSGIEGVSSTAPIQTQTQAQVQNATSAGEGGSAPPQ